MKKSTIFLLGFLMVMPALVMAEIIDFEDLQFDHNTQFISIPGGYHGFQWSGARVLDPAAYNGGVYLSTFGQGIASGTNVATSLNMAVNSDTAFDFIGAYFSNADFPNTGLMAYGLKNGANLYQQSLVLTNNTQFYSFNFLGIDELLFIGNVGETIPAHFSMDDFTLNRPVPEPATMLLLGSGLLGLVGFRRKFKR